MKKEIKGLIFDIQGYSVHDGPGCRTLVFMKGCPLRCEWCQNPEGLRTAQDLLFRNTRCINRKGGCSRCIDACPYHAIVQNPDESEAAPQILIDRTQCNRCVDHPCVSVCYFEGLLACGKWQTVDELMDIFERNRHYWGTRGGVSFSGGEPLQQYAFMQALFESCRDANIHIAVETSAYAQPERFLKLMSMVDFAFVDIKHMDSTQHRKKTGRSNDLVLNNIAALAKSRWPGRLILRLPVIEGFNDADDNIVAVAAFMQQLGLFEINILPFHRLGQTKWNQLGKEYLYDDKTSTTNDKLLQIQDVFLSRHIACFVGSDTPF